MPITRLLPLLMLLPLLAEANAARGQADKAAAQAGENSDSATQRSIRRQQLKSAAPADPVVMAIVESKPKTPIELFQAIDTLASLEQFDLAKRYLKQLLDANPDADALNRLVLKFGSPAVERIQSTPQLAPEAVELGKLIAAALAQRREDTARLVKMVDQLTAADPLDRQTAMLELKRAGDRAVQPLVAAIIANRQPNLTIAARAVLTQLGGDAFEPLIGLLRSGNAAEQAAAADLLGKMRAERALPDLAIAAISADANVRDAAKVAFTQIAGRTLDDAALANFVLAEAQRLRKSANTIDSQDYYGAPPPLVELWLKNDQTGLVSRLMPGAQFARTQAKSAINAFVAAVGVDKLTPEQRQLYWSITLDEAKQRVGWDRPLTANDVNATADDLAALVESLQLALKNREIAVAVAAIELLGQMGTPELLVAINGRPSPLAQAANDGNRRVRFAAIQAIVALHPRETFAGASAVGEGLKFFANTLGVRRGLVVDPRSLAAQQIGSFLSGLGYDSEIATNGRSAFNFATSSADFEFAIIHMATANPRIDYLLLQLRKDPRTAEMPIALVAVPGAETTADRLARGYRLVYAVPEPQSAADVAHFVQRLWQQPGADAAGGAQRMAQAAWATQTLADLIANPQPWIDAINITRSLQLNATAALPDLSAPAITLLGNSPAAGAQVQLAQVLTKSTLPATTRRAAALALSRNLTKHGNQLPQSVVAGLYDRYNENAGRNPETHELLTLVLDALEAKDEPAAEAAPAINPTDKPRP